MKPEDPAEDDIRRQLRGAFPPIDPELHGDLWPAMLRRIQEEPSRGIPWYDWVLVGCSMVLLAVFPKLAWLFAYHL